jgi:hypothetical protein
MELGNIQVQVLFADLVEGADAAAFYQRPEALDCVGVDCTNNVLAFEVIDGLRAVDIPRAAACGPSIGPYRANLPYARLLLERQPRQGAGADVLDNAGEPGTIITHKIG